MIFWIWLLVLVLAVTLYLRQVYSRFNRYGVKYATPVPFFGNLARMVFRLEHFADIVDNTYKTFRNERFVGTFEFIKPVLNVHDLELLKKITVKDFEHFLNHRPFVDEKTDKLFGRSLFILQDQEWKDMRSTLSPAFTSSKIRLMVPFMVEVGDQMITELKKKIKDTKSGVLDVEVKDLTTRYANDVIASCAFGLKVNSHADEDNQFYKMGNETANFTFKQVLLMFAYSAMPALVSKLKIELFSEEVKKFFRTLVMDTMQDRKARDIIRPDMIHLLMEAKSGKLVHEDKTAADADAGFATVEESVVGKKDVTRVWTDDDLIAQAVLFFIAGFETVSSSMSFLLHELAINSEIQEKLYQEIKENDIKNGGKFDYNSIQQMRYLDMVISESLRLWPPAVATDRLCTKDYNLGKPNDEATQDYIIRKGEGLQIPVWSFHRDPEYFPNPLKFDPERFSDQNKHNIKPFTYIPFGLGPRNCIGSRFALCEVKVMTYQLLQHMELSPGEKTQIPAKLSKDTFNIRIDGGHWVRFRPRN